MSDDIVYNFLIDLAEIRKSKNEEYMDKDRESNYHKHGKVMFALFPNGIELKSVEDFNRYAILDMIVGKLTRYSNNFETGHEDSLIDLSIYCQMLRELDLNIDKV